ncbi:phosphoserine transaminase [Bartonella sp. DGB1]|uniref:phosphoserine transaminase n=1 Tax=Bartonella sp. DGB1 TaxID=3239807 RepID=UPI003525B5AF
MTFLLPKPVLRPTNPNFSSGPCSKYPGWNLSILQNSLLGRSHRSTVAITRLQKALNLTRELLQVPNDYIIAMVPASDTGAIEMAFWSLLGQRPVDILSWDHFGQEWVKDVTEQLKIKDSKIIKADYGYLPDFSKINFSNDVIFTWNATSSGVKIPNADFIPINRSGLTICDATSATFAQELDFNKLDVTTFSWQKSLGGEASHGMLILSPRAVHRLETYNPPWPIPKIFRLTENGKLISRYFEGYSINTPSMLCLEDYIQALEWGLSIGGLPALIDRCNKNANILWKFIATTPWLENLAQDPQSYSNTSVCIKIIDPCFLQLSTEQASNFIKNMILRLEQEKVAYDISSYKTAPIGLRIWCGATIEQENIRRLLPWLTWAFEQEKLTII